MATEGNVNLPLVGQTKKKTATYAAVGLVGVAAIYYWRQHQANSATSSTASTAATGASSNYAGSSLGQDPYPSDGTVGNPNDPYSIDPQTGVTYGDEQMGYGYGNSYYNPADYYGSGGSGSGGSGSSGPPFTTNADWSQYAENYLTGTVGLPANTVSSALGLYITGGVVTSAQQDIINQAIAIAGVPPVTGPNGMPPAINLGSSSTGSITVPNVVGLSLSAAEADLTTAGLTYQISGTGVNGNVTAQDPAAGRKVNSGALVTLTVGSSSTEVTVPKVTGMRAEDAAAAVQKVGLVAHVTPGTPHGKTGHIVDQSPAGGTKAAKGSTVTLDNKIT